MKPLIYFKNGDKFIHGKKLYTVYQHEGHMTEVFHNGRFWAWPNYNGIDLLKVQPFNDI